MMTTVLAPVLCLSSVLGGLQSNADILDKAEARIQQYRTGVATLRLTDPGGRLIRSGRRAKIEQTRHKFLFGSNIFMLGKCRTPEQNAAYADRFAALLNYATLPFYWWVYEPARGQPNYSATEATLAWCREHGVTPKGHPLAWNWRDPAWLPREPESAMRLQMGRIGEVAGRFKGEIGFWDVVNEATQFDRPRTEAQAPTLTEGVHRLGVRAYLQEAFRAAREANPQATLLINDYKTDGSYVQNVISKLTDDSGRPLYDVIGIQCHQHAGAWPPEKIWEICERFAALGKPLHFTEATILSGQPGYDLKAKNPQFKWESTPEGEQRQAEEVARFYTALFSHPAVEAITWWDLSDQGAWQGAPAGLLRADMTPKPAYDALMRLVKGQWWTRAEVRVGRRGGARFRGFFGDYKITVEDAGRKLTGTFSLDKSTRKPIEVRLEE